MRLLETHQRILHDFVPSNIPKYAILSHVWGNPEDEILLKDFETGVASSKPAYSKVSSACDQAVAHGLSWIWIDTCCIDKTSSAELSEAINSMYKWYANSQICFAYLEDVEGSEDLLSAQLAASRWFKRGWTLQELIAPSQLWLFSKSWKCIGTKQTLCKTITRITGIDGAILTKQKRLDTTSIANRMSWTSARQTSRPEDVAYCLMGLFDVNMPLLYGEGNKAFYRLQEEIMKFSDDQSLFAWRADASNDSKSGSTDVDAKPIPYYGLLAKHPKQFAESGNVVPYRYYVPPFSMSNKGLRIELCLEQVAERNLYLAALDCCAPPQVSSFVGVYLTRISKSRNEYVRIRPTEFCSIETLGVRTAIYIPHNVVHATSDDMYPYHVLQLRKGSLPSGLKLDQLVHYQSKIDLQIAGTLAEEVPARAWIPQDLPILFALAKRSTQWSVALAFKRRDGSKFVIILGSMENSTLGFKIQRMASDMILPDKEQLQREYQTFPLGTEWRGRAYSVQDVEIRVNWWLSFREMTKYHMVDIVIEEAANLPTRAVPKVPFIGSYR